LIDLDGSHSCKRLEQRRTAKDLAVLLSRVPMNPREQLFFWAAYKRARGKSFPVRPLIHQVLLNDSDRSWQDFEPLS